MHRCGCRRQIVDARGENSRQPPPPQTDRRRNRSGAGSERPAGDSSAFMNRNDLRPSACLSVCLSVCLVVLLAPVAWNWSRHCRPRGLYLAAFPARGAVGRGRGGTASPTFFDRGDASPTPPTFWSEIRAEVSPLLQCKIISVQQN